MDVLTDVLDTVRFGSAVFLRAELRGQWGVSSQRTPELAAALVSRPATDTDAILFHVVLEGSAYLEAGSVDPVHASTGDVLMITRGGHTMADSPGRAAVPVTSLLSQVDESSGVIRVGSGDTCSRLACGFFLFERVGLNPMLASLPDVLHVRASEYATPRLRSTLTYFLEEAGSERPGCQTLLNRLAEVMFVEVVRSRMGGEPAVAENWLAALEDEYVGRVLRLIHRSPDRDWTVEKLARSVGISRSGLAARFSDVVGTSPIRYLTRWRMRKAAHLLQGERSIDEVAADVGYSSRAAFSRAFKRHVGVPPAAWASQRAS